jgi:3-ketosteroid 9alpha-monooxygenase subunit A
MPGVLGRTAGAITSLFQWADSGECSPAQLAGRGALWHCVLLARSRAIAAGFRFAAHPAMGRSGLGALGGPRLSGDLQHPIEIFDNTSDIAHLTHLHGGGGVSRYENEIRGQFFYQRETQGADVADVRGKSSNAMTTLGRYVGPGMLFSHFLEANAIQLICHTPVEDGQARLWQACMLKSPTGAVDDTARAAHERFRGLMCGGLMKDAEVWKHKRPALQIMQLPSDGPFRQSRVWYSQFYNPRDKAAAILARVEGKHFARGTPEFGVTDAPDP